MAYTKNYYQILGLDTPSSGSAPNRLTAPELRRAYRNALLAAHPDKKTATNKGTYSVDDVKDAYRIISDVRSRAEYDNWLLRNPQILSMDSRVNGHGGGQTLSQDFILGLELLDLSDFEEQESGGEGVEDVEWTRACRCGDEKGFRISEEDLEDAERREEKEVLVGCGGCSLWVRVGFEVEEE